MGSPSPVGPMSSAELEPVATAQQGATPDFGEMLESFRGYLLWLANYELSDDLRAKSGASDFVQQTFLRAHERIDTFQGKSREELLAWLRRILLNTLANFRRDFRDAEKRCVARELALGSASSSQMPAHHLPAQQRSVSSQCIQLEQHDQLAAALGRLQEDYRRVIVLRYWQGLSFQQIGQELSRSSDAVRKLWARAIRRLQSELNRSADESA